MRSKSLIMYGPRKWAVAAATAAAQGAASSGTATRPSPATQLAGRHSPAACSAGGMSTGREHL